MGLMRVMEVVMCSEDRNLQKQTRQLLLTLSMNSRQIPSSLYLSGSIEDPQERHSQGGFGSVYMSSYNNMAVAVKQIHGRGLGRPVSWLLPQLDGIEIKEWVGYFTFCI